MINKLTSKIFNLTIKVYSIFSKNTLFIIFWGLSCHASLVHSDTGIDDYQLSYMQTGSGLDSFSCDNYQFQLNLSNHDSYSQLHLSSNSEATNSTKNWRLQNNFLNTTKLFTGCLETGQRHYLRLKATGNWYEHRYWSWQYHEVTYSFWGMTYSFELPFYWYTDEIRKYPDIDKLIQTIDVPDYRYLLQAGTEPDVSIQQVNHRPNHFEIIINFEPNVFSNSKLYINGLNLTQGEEQQLWVVDSDIFSSGKRTVQLNFNHSGPYKIIAEAIGKKGRKYFHGNEQYETYKHLNTESKPGQLSVGNSDKLYWLSNIDQDNHWELLNYDLSDSTLYLNSKIDPQTQDLSGDFMADLLGKITNMGSTSTISKALIQFGASYNSQHADISIHDVVGARSNSPDDITVVFPQLCEAFIFSNKTINDAIDAKKLPLNELDADKQLNLCSSNLSNYSKATIAPFESSDINNGANKTSIKTLVLYSENSFKTLDIMASAEQPHGEDAFFHNRFVSGVKQIGDNCNTGHFSSHCSSIANSERFLFIQPYKINNQLELIVSTIDRYQGVKFYSYKQGFFGYELVNIDPDYVLDVGENGHFDQYAFTPYKQITYSNVPKLGQCQNFVLPEPEGERKLFAIKNGCLSTQPNDFDANSYPEIYVKNLINTFEKPLYLQWNSQLKNFSSANN